MAALVARIWRWGGHCVGRVLWQETYRAWSGAPPALGSYIILVVCGVDERHIVRGVCVCVAPAASSIER